MTFQSGDRVRWSATGDDGLPLVQYGYIGGVDDEHRRAVVMLDGQIQGNTIVPFHELAPVTITTVELRLSGCDLLDDPSLRQGLVSLWSAEADQAGLEIGSMAMLGTGILNGNGFSLAELQSGGEQYVLRASAQTHVNMVWVRADQP